MQRRGSGSRGAGGTAAAGSGGAGPGGGGTAAAVTVPAHKVIPGTGGAVTVDAFRYAHPGVKAYFLTHAHSDHYTGLSEAWCAGPVYCSELTARLVAHLTGVSTAWLRPLPLGRPVVVEGLVEVTLVDANHCPGAVQLLFRVLPRGGGGGAAGGGAGGVGGVDATDAAKSAGGSTRGADAGCSSGAGAVRYLHCGDMRYSPAMQSWPQLGAWRGCEGVFLDTTYCQPKHTFPTQDEAVDYVASQIHERTGLRIHVSSTKLDVLRLLLPPEPNPDPDAGVAAAAHVFTDDPAASPVHVVGWGTLGETWPYFRPNFVNMQRAAEIMGARCVVGFVPTGWTYEMKRSVFSVHSKGALSVHLVPYSEHSSYPELLEYVKWLRPRQVIPTVGVKEGDREGERARAAMLARFRSLARPAQQRGQGKAEPFPEEAGVGAGTGAAAGVDAGTAALTGGTSVRAASGGGASEAAAAAPAVKVEPGAQPSASPTVQAAPAYGTTTFGDGETASAAAHSTPGKMARTGNDVVELPDTPGPRPPATAPAAPASTSAAAATAADAATAAAALAMSWEACREALLLPLERYDPVRHACWGPAHCGDGGAAAANSTSSAAASAAGAASGRGPTPYLHVALCLSALSSTTKRLAISDALTNMFRSVLAAADDPGRDLVAALYLVTGRIAPEYDKTELNVGGATVSGALQAATGASAARLKQLYREHGDLGDVAAACRRTQSTLRNPAPLLCGRLLAALRDVAADKGQGVAARRQAVVLGLLRACRDVEVRFLVRTLISNLRVGANWRSVLAPLGRAVLLHQRATAAVAAAADGSATTAAVQSPAPAELEAAGAAVLEAYHTCPNFEILVPVLLRHGIEGLRTRCGLTLGVPLKPMLANACAGPAAEPGEAAGPEEPAAAEGAAAARVPAQPPGPTPEAGMGTHVTVQVCVFVFDLLEWNGTSLLHRPLRERRSLLPAALPGMSPGRVMLATAVELQPLQPLQPSAVDREDGEEGPAAEVPVRMWPAPGEPAAPAVVELLSSDEDGPGSEGPYGRPHADDTGAPPAPEHSKAAAVGGHDPAAAAAQQPPCQPGPPSMGASRAVMDMLLQSFNTGAEGLMLKRLDGASAYEPSRRSEAWIKASSECVCVKRDYCEGLRDSVDVVPIGAWYGQGRKVKWFSPFLLAVWDPVREEFQSLCRCMSGFSDQFYAAAKERLGATIIPGPKPYYNTGERCSVWFEPTEVWELRGADLTLSPVHRAASGRLHTERGVGMRFPRFIRVRDDKRPEDATTPDDIVHLYNKQTRKVVVGERGGGDVGRAAGAARPATGCGGAAAVQAQGAQGAGASKRSGRGRDNQTHGGNAATAREPLIPPAGRLDSVTVSAGVCGLYHNGSNSRWHESLLK
eukprot:XP_001698007.1 predicted protein [Chlamydomonas reinhardtii]